MTRLISRCLPAALLAFALALGSAGPAIALDADEMFADPAQETRARELGRQLRCLKCRNQSIFDSNAGIAKDLRVVVRERMAAGDSDTEVLAYVAERFGDYVLLKPRVSPQNYVLWLAPIGFLGLGGLALWGYLRRRPMAGATGPALSEAEALEAQKILDGEVSR